MNALKTIFSWLGRFLQRVRTILLDLGTLVIVVLLATTIIGALTSFGPEDADTAGKVLFIKPQGVVVDLSLIHI